MQWASWRGVVLWVFLVALVFGGIGCMNATGPQPTKTPSTQSGPEPEKLLTPPTREPG
jgi:hypothetical protein